jgi:hypothetical protein
LSGIAQAISLQKCIQIADIFSLVLLHKCLLPKCKKKSQKAWRFPANCLYNRQTFYWHIPSKHKCLCRLKTDNWFIGRWKKKLKSTNKTNMDNPVAKFFLIISDASSTLHWEFFFRIINDFVHTLRKVFCVLITHKNFWGPFLYKLQNNVKKT